MIDKELVRSVVEQALDGGHLFLVDVNVRPGNIIVIEVDSDENIGVDDCVLINRKVEAQLDRDVEDYELEVGSAGLTSPFKIPRQYQKNVGNQVEVLTKGGQKLVGTLKASDDTGFTITVTTKTKPEGSKKKIDVEEDFAFQYIDIKHTKYLITFK